jgi:hypothetical protein
MVRMRVFVMAFLAAGLWTVPPATAEEAAVVDISGVYRCDGVNPQGQPYRGMVEIVKIRNAYQLRWTFPQSKDAALGIGIISNGVLAVSYYGGEMAGVVVYRVDKDKPLTGEWAVVGSEGGVFPETLTRLSGHGTPTERAPRLPPTLGNPSTIIEG